MHSYKAVALVCLVALAASMADVRAQATSVSDSEVSAKSASLTDEDRTRSLKAFSVGFELWQAGDCNAAVMAFRRGLDIDPANPKANFYYGDCLQRLRRREEAKEAFQRAVRFGDGTPEGYKAQAALDDLLKPQNVTGLSAAQYEKIWLGDWELTISMKNFRSGELKIFRDDYQLRLSMTGGYQWQESFFSGAIDFANAIFRDDRIEFVTNASATGIFRGKLVSETEIRGTADWGSHGAANWVAVKRTSTAR